MFDSGVGGLSILRAVRTRLPSLPIHYVADSAYAPYGERGEAEIRDRCERITRHLLQQGARLVVVACNTATAVAIDALRKAHPGVPFVGVEPGLRPALASSRSRHVAIMATPATLRSARFDALLQREAAGGRVHLQACAGLAAAIERGRRDDPRLQALIALHAGQVRDAGVDVVALGCTHYPFVRAELEAVLGDRVLVIDTADAVAAQVARLWGQGHSDAPAACRIETTGDPRQLTEFVSHWLGWTADVLPQPLSV